MVGFTDQVVSYSFDWDRANIQTMMISNVLRQLMGGQTLGLAMELINGNYASLATELSAELEGLDMEKPLNYSYLAGLWTAEHDMLNLSIFGDPAVRI